MPAGGRERGCSAPYVCTGPITYKGQAALQTDIDNLKAALTDVPVAEAFMPAISPTNIEAQQPNEYYPTEEAYLYAIADAMRRSTTAS